jgi:hypothetical protein
LMDTLPVENDTPVWADTSSSESLVIEKYIWN